MQLSSEQQLNISGGASSPGAGTSLLEVAAFIRGEREESRKEREDWQARLETQALETDRVRQEMERARQETQAKMEQQQAEAKAETDQLREAAHASKLREQALKMREQQVVALQARLEILYAAELLADEELHVVEDAIADSEESGENDRVPTLISLSGKMTSDRAFARQLQRKRWM